MDAFTLTHGQMVTPSLTVSNADAAIAFYQRILGARLAGPVLRGPSQQVMHAELLFGETRIYLNDEPPEAGSYTPGNIGGTPITLQLLVDDVDDVYEKALVIGSKAKMPPHDANWGARYAVITDPFGLCWALSTHGEVVCQEEMRKRSTGHWVTSRTA